MSAYGFALAFFFVVFWADEIATVTLWLAAAAIIVGGSLWTYYNPNAALAALGIFAPFTCRSSSAGRSICHCVAGMA
jgi:hypothetical protein